VATVREKSGFQAARSAAAGVRGKVASEYGRRVALAVAALLAIAPVLAMGPVACARAPPGKRVVTGQRVSSRRLVADPRVSWHRVSPIALGLNVAPWDSTYAANTSAGGGVNVIDPSLRSAGVGLLRYGGGSFADFYDWQTNSSIQNCLPYDATARSLAAARDRTRSASAGSQRRPERRERPVS
jgi:hypothetical protein